MNNSRLYRLMVWDTRKKQSMFQTWRTISVNTEMYNYFYANDIKYFPIVGAIHFNNEEDILAFCLRFGISG